MQYEEKNQKDVSCYDILNYFFSLEKKKNYSILFFSRNFDKNPKLQREMNF